MKKVGEGSAELSEYFDDSREPLDPNAFIVALMGSSGAGKTAIARLLCEKGIADGTPSWTTRPPGDDEESTSYDHKFVTPEEFEQQKRRDGFILQRPLYGYEYGLPIPKRPPEGKVPLILIKAVVAKPLLLQYPNARLYQVEASIDVLSERIRDRSRSTEEDTDIRLKKAEEETQEGRLVAQRMFNNDGSIEDSLDQVIEAIKNDAAEYRSRSPLL